MAQRWQRALGELRRLTSLNAARPRHTASSHRQSHAVSGLVSGCPVARHRARYHALGEPASHLRSMPTPTTRAATAMRAARQAGAFRQKNRKSRCSAASGFAWDDGRVSETRSAGWLVPGASGSRRAGAARFLPSPSAPKPHRRSRHLRVARIFVRRPRSCCSSTTPRSQSWSSPRRFRRPATTVRTGRTWRVATAPPPWRALRRGELQPVGTLPSGVGHVARGCGSRYHSRVGRECGRRAACMDGG